MNSMTAAAQEIQQDEIGNIEVHTQDAEYDLDNDVNELP
jgi:hypothetical protein